MKPTDELKTKLIKALRDLKNNTLDDNSRKAAYADVVNISEQIEKFDNTFKMDTRMLKNYKPFKSAKVKPRVVWPELDSNDQFNGLEKCFDKLTSLAVKKVTERLPREPQDSQLFGMCVNATTGHLIQLQATLK